MKYFRFLLSSTLLFPLFGQLLGGGGAFAQQVDPRELALRKLVQSTVMINAMYVDTVNFDHQVEDAITGMLSKLDPHSTYTNAKDT